MNDLINELNSRKIPGGLARKIDAKITFLNNLQPGQKTYLKKVKNINQAILKKELKLIPRNYFINIWMATGMSALGLPIGVAIFAGTGNGAFIAVGLPIGLGIGSMYGTSLEKKAEAENRVLKISEERTDYTSPSTSHFRILLSASIASSSSCGMTFRKEECCSMAYSSFSTISSTVSFS